MQETRAGCYLRGHRSAISEALINCNSLSSSGSTLSLTTPIVFDTHSTIPQMTKLWRPGDKTDVHGNSAEIHDQAMFETVESSIEALDKDLRELSLDISGPHD